MTIMIIHKEKNIWKAAQPMFLLAFGFSSMFVNLSTLVFLGENTRTTCLLRPWIFNVSFTTLFAIMFVKVHTVYTLFTNKKIKKKNLQPTTLSFRIFMIILIEITIQVVWTLVDPNTSVAKISTGEYGEVFERIVCNSEYVIFPTIAIGYKILLATAGCFLAWKTRNVHSAFAESKQLLLVMCQIAFLSAIMLLLYYFLDTSQTTKILILAVVVFSVSLMSSVMLFGTRIFQLYTSGDIDLQEIVATMLVSERNAAHDIRNAL
jgi:hypothetical protein